jgi:hypothetical protein
VYALTADADYTRHIDHWDGASFSRTDAPNLPYQAVFAVAPDDIWAYAWESDPGKDGGYEGWLLHSDGRGWQIVEHGDNGYDGLWAAAPDDVWLVGPGLRHFDGATWTQEPFPLDGYNCSLAGRAHDDVWLTCAVGGSAHFDGTRWTPVAPPWTGARDGWVAGNGAYWIAGPGGGIQRWDGASWWTNDSGVGLDGAAHWWLTAVSAWARDDVWV